MTNLKKYLFLVQMAKIFQPGLLKQRIFKEYWFFLEPTLIVIIQIFYIIWNEAYLSEVVLKLAALKIWIIS